MARSIVVIVTSLRATRASVPVDTLIWMTMATRIRRRSSDRSRAAPRLPTALARASRPCRIFMWGRC